MKKCTACGQSKALTEFYKKGNGYYAECKLCLRLRSKKYAYDKEKQKEYRKARYQREKEKEKEYVNLPYVKERRRLWKKEYYQKNREKILEQAKNRRHESNTYEKNRRRTDANYHLLCNLRSRLNSALQGKLKDKTTKDLLGCHLTLFRRWIEYQFSDEMTWDNYGKVWELDHVKPCSSFNLSNEEELEKCFYWENIRPLLKVDNRKKSNNYNIHVISQHEETIKSFHNTLN